MTWASIMLLVIGLGVIIASCIGMMLLRDPLDRLHLVTPASTIGVIATCASVVVRQGVNPSGTAAVLIAVVIPLASPFVSHATARSIVIRRRDQHANRSEVS